MKNLSRFFVILILTPFLLVGAFFVSQNVKADNGAITVPTSSSDTIALSPGWNIVSTPKVLSSHQILNNVAETSDNFDIFVLDPTSPSGWNTMQGIGQTQFQPLFAYFINNKTGQPQTLKLNYNLNLDPTQRLFQRTLKPGWNGIGIALPDSTIQWAHQNPYSGLVSTVLNQVNSSALATIDFTANQSDPNSVGISSQWNVRPSLGADDVSSLQNLKGYGAYITQTTSVLMGYENLSETEYNLTYAAGTNGSITGNLSQSVYAGLNGTSVTAVPDTGYQFANWSDGSTQNPRTDTGVSNNVNITANFAATPLQYTLTYVPGANGGITGNASQTVISGSDGTTVTAVAMSGYHFVDWSDGSTTNPRTDTNVVADINVTANFTKTTNPSTLTVTADSSTPTSTSINVNHTSGTTDVPMFVFDAKSVVGSSTITDLKFTVTGDAAALAKVNAIKLYDGSTLLGAQSLNSSTASFSDLSIPVAQDATRALTVKADFAAGVTNSTGVIVSIATPSIDVIYRQPDLTSANPTSSAVIGNEMYLFDGASVHLSFISATSSYTYNATTPSASYTTCVITFNAGADGGTLTELTNSTVKVNWCTSSSCNTLSTSNVNVQVTPNQNTPDGSQATVTVSMTVPRSTSSTGFVNFSIPEIDWTVGGASASQTWGLGDYKTPYVNVQ